MVTVFGDSVTVVGGSVTVEAAGVSVTKTVSSGCAFVDGGICVANNEDCGVETTVTVDIIGDIDDEILEVTAAGAGVAVLETTRVVVATCVDE